MLCDVSTPARDPLAAADRGASDGTDGADLLGRCVDTLHAYFELGNDLHAVGGATIVGSRRCPRVYDANCVTRVRVAAGDGLEDLLATVERHAGAAGHRCFKLDPLADPAVEARLILEGYEPRAELQLLLTGELTPPEPARRDRTAPPNVAIRPVSTGADWAGLARLIRADHEESAARNGRVCWEQAVTDQMLDQKRLKAPDVTFFLASYDGRDCGFFSSWPGVGGVGKVEDLFTLPGFRHRGVATALIRHAVADARRRGAGPVLIGADPADTPKRMYAALGFRPVLVYRSYLRI